VRRRSAGRRAVPLQRRAPNSSQLPRGGPLPAGAARTAASLAAVQRRITSGHLPRAASPSRAAAAAPAA